MTLVAALLLAAGLLATGDLALRALRWRGVGAAERLAFATVAGLVVSLLVLYLPVAATGRVLFAPLLGLHAVACAVATARLVRSARGARALRLGPVALLACGALVLHLDVVRARPFSNYDAKAIYGLKAKALLHERSLETPVWQDPEVVHYHPDYPLGLPLLMAYGGWLAEGPVRDGAGHVPAGNAAEWVARYDATEAAVPLSVLWVAAFVALVFSRARRLRLPVPWLLAVGAVPLALVAPMDLGASWRATPELPLALCLGVAAAALFPVTATRSAPRDGEDGPAHRPPSRRALAVAALAAAGAVLLKNDALFGLMALGLATAVGVTTRGAARLRAPAALAAGSAAGALLVGLGRRFVVDAPYDERYVDALLGADLTSAVARLVALPEAVALALDDARGVPFWCFLVAIALPVAWRAGGWARTAAAAVAVHLALCLLVFVVTPNHVHWHVRTALVRLWSQMAGPACFVAVLALGRLLTLGGAGAADEDTDDVGPDAGRRIDPAGV